MGKFMSVFIDTQRYNRDMLENNLLIPANLPTKTDVDEINAELYHLKKMVRELNNKVRELSEKG
jgi:polyhydroxyalkanoate synthesis regulator phasin